MELAADRIRNWSQREKELAGKLATLREPGATSNKTAPTDPEVVEEGGTPAAAVQLPDPFPLVEVPWDPTSLDPWEPAAGTPFEHPSSESTGRTAAGPASPGLEGSTARSAGPFDGLFEAVSEQSPDSLRPAGPLPPPTRFRVRVAPVTKSRRPTKRNYDYFEKLNAKLADQAWRSAAGDGWVAEPPSPECSTGGPDLADPPSGR